MAKDLQSHKPRTECTKREKRLILDRLRNIRAALINHCVNWRSIFKDYKSVNEIPDMELLKFTERLGGIHTRTLPWVANSRDKTQDFEIIANPHGLLVSHIAVDASISGIVSFMFSSNIHLSWATAPHISKPVYRLRFMDIGYIRQVSKITPIELMNKIAESLTGLPNLFYDRVGPLDIIIQEGNVKTRLGNYSKNQRSLTIRPIQTIHGVEKVVLDLSKQMDFVGIPTIYFILRNTTDPEELLANTKIVNQFLVNILNSL